MFKYKFYTLQNYNQQINKSISKMNQIFNFTRHNIPTKHCLSFFINGIGPGRLVRSEYDSPIFADQLPYDSVRLFLRKLEAINHQKTARSQFYFGCAFSSIGLGTARWIRDHMSRSTQLTLKMFLSGAAITMGIASCFALWNHLAAEREMKALIDEENKALLEEGLKWYLPKGSEIIELCTDCKCENKLSCNDEKIVFNSYQPSQTINLLTDYRFLFSKPALNDEEIVYKLFQPGETFRNASAINDEYD